jgi:hypothetical protein
MPPIPQHANGHETSASFTKNLSVNIIQIPRDLVLKVPSEENQHRYKRYTKYKPIEHRIQRGCCRCLCASICLLVLILIAIGCISYFLFRPKTSTYASTDLSISGFEPLLNSPVTPLNPSIVATVQTENPNKRISLLYQAGSLISVNFDQLHLCDGVWPVFRQKPKNVTVLEMNLLFLR